MHEILNAIHEIVPIGGVNVLRESWIVNDRGGSPALHGKVEGKKQHVQIFFKNIYSAPPNSPGRLPFDFLQKVEKKLRQSGFKVTRLRSVLAGSHRIVTKGGHQYKLRADIVQGEVGIEPISQKISVLQEKRIKAMAAKLIKD